MFVFFLLYHSFRKKKSAKNAVFSGFLALRFMSRGRGDRPPVNGFGDRRTTAVLFPYIMLFPTDELYYNTTHTN